MLDMGLAIRVAHDLGGVLQLDDHVLLHLGQLQAEAIGFELVLETEDHQFTHARSLSWYIRRATLSEGTAGGLSGSLTLCTGSRQAESTVPGPRRLGSRFKG